MMRDSQRRVLGSCLRSQHLVDWVAALVAEGYSVRFRRVPSRYGDQTSPMYRPSDHEVLIETSEGAPRDYDTVHVASASGDAASLIGLMRQVLVTFAEARW